MTIPKRTLKLMNFFNIDFYYGLLHGDVRKNYSPGNFLLKGLGIIVVSIHRFVKDACFVSASAMTFYSILSFIPLVALIFGIGKGFGFEFLLEDFVRSKLYLNVDVADFIIGSAQKALENARGGVVTGFGIVLLLWAVIKLLTNAETAINNVWRVTSSRSVARRFTDYFSIMFVVPVLLLLILSINVFMTTNLKQLIAEGGMWRYAGNLLYSVMRILPYVLVWILFVFLYMFVPTVPVKFRYAIVAGVIAGSVYQIVQWFYIRFQIGVSAYNAVYGSLAAIPLLLAWLQLSWSIVLWGAQLCYVLKNGHMMYHRKNEWEPEWKDYVSYSIRILNYVAGEHVKGKGGALLEEINARLGVDYDSLERVLKRLVEVGILVRVDKKDNVFYYPAVDFHTLSIADIIYRFNGISQEADEAWVRRYFEAVDKELGEDKFVK